MTDNDPQYMSWHRKPYLTTRTTLKTVGWALDALYAAVVPAPQLAPIKEFKGKMGWLLNSLILGIRWRCKKYKYGERRINKCSSL